MENNIFKYIMEQVAHPPPLLTSTLFEWEGTGLILHGPIIMK